MKLKRYRIAVEATVCFDIDAESEREALEQAQAAVMEASWLDGEGVDGLDNARAYLGPPTPPQPVTIQDEYEL